MTSDAIVPLHDLSFEELESALFPNDGSASVHSRRTQRDDRASLYGGDAFCAPGVPHYTRDDNIGTTGRDDDVESDTVLRQHCNLAPLSHHLTNSVPVATATLSTSAAITLPQSVRAAVDVNQSDASIPSDLLHGDRAVEFSNNGEPLCLLSSHSASVVTMLRLRIGTIFKLSARAYLWLATRRTSAMHYLLWITWPGARDYPLACMQVESSDVQGMKPWGLVDADHVMVCLPSYAQVATALLQGKTQRQQEGVLPSDQFLTGPLHAVARLFCRHNDTDIACFISVFPVRIAQLAK